ncbi:MAG: histidine kinase [Nocardioides sp.]|uniref:sensor histidine kinase n=1 Tax=Nocardioides sp. TaxID=35761 RepID=UPI0039E6B7C8
MAGRPTQTDWIVTVGTLAMMLTTASVRTGVFAVPEPALLGATLLSWLPLLGRTAWPLGALAGTVIVEAFHIALLGSMSLPPPGDPMGAYQPVPVATMVAAYTLASRTRPRLAWSASGAASALLLLTGLVFHGRPLLATDMVAVDLVLIATGVGAVVGARRERARRAAGRIAEETRQAVLDERLRIARDLHDALAHNLTLVNAQAAVADYLLRTDPDAAETALRDITQHSRQAIDELRATVGLLRYDEGDPSEGATGETLRPVPGLSQLDELVAGFRAGGTPVELAGTGAPQTLDQQTDLAAYRILQEALTNAAKHAPGGAVAVELDWTTPGSLTLTTINAVAPGRHAPLLPGTGHGLIGMNERATAAGGSLRAGPLRDGTFEVRATLPATVAPLPAPSEGDPR